ncbi:MAG: inositol monophosphatase family protein [Verrucomicrobiales bacterium]
MKGNELKSALATATDAAREVGLLMKKNLNSSSKKVNEAKQHDIKLELDVRCQKLITKRLMAAFPGIAILGEEGTTGDISSELRWVVDPIDGTVNFTYGIPHACVSIALQRRKEMKRAPKFSDEPYETLVGMVYDPFADEVFSGIRGGPALLNGKKMSASKRTRLDEAIVSIGFAKSSSSLEKMLPQFNHLVHRVRKIRIMGAAALAMVYVAAGRFDAYVEGGVRLWDIAAGGLILECAGGEFWNEPVDDDHTYRIIANNGLLRKKLLPGK